MTLKMKLAVFASLLVFLPYQAKASCVGKTVDVWVTNGHDLTGDGLGYPDPYVKVTIDGVTKQTKTVYSNDSPLWNQKFHFYKVKNDIIMINIWEADGGGDDDHLGTCVERMYSKDGHWQRIRCMANDSGFVNVYYRCR